jgi:glycosyltransferase involved in cell wall biosynthesis
MKIGFDVSQTGSKRTGCGNFAYSLLRALAEEPLQHDYVLYPTFGDYFFDPDWPRSTYLPDRPNFTRGGPRHREHYALQRFWSAPPSDLEARFGNPDIIHSNNFFCPLGMRNARLIYTLYDLSFLENPEWHVEANRVSCFEGVFQASLHADHILAISQFSKQHFLEVFPHYPTERVSVVHLGSRFSRRQGMTQPRGLERLIPQQFWLCVGTLEPRKNHARLLNSYAKLKAAPGQTRPLVIAGAKGWRTEHLDRLIDDLRLNDHVIATGYLSDDAMQWLYQNCYAALYPSLFEGFGLPVLEAMSQGAAVIASNATSIPEIAGDAALLVDPYSEEEIFAAMLRLSGNNQLRAQLQVRAFERACQFGWEATARRTLECYEEVGRMPRLHEKTTIERPMHETGFGARNAESQEVPGNRRNPGRP